MCIVAVSNLVGNHPPGVEIHDNTNKVLHLIKAIVGHITHPYLIWMFCGEISLHYVLAFSGLIIMTLLGTNTNTSYNSLGKCPDNYIGTTQVTAFDYLIVTTTNRLALFVPADLSIAFDYVLLIRYL